MSRITEKKQRPVDDRLTALFSPSESGPCRLICLTHKAFAGVISTTLQLQGRSRRLGPAGSAIEAKFPP